MDSKANQTIHAHKTLAIIMGGGAGTRLFPLTHSRSKPAVPLGGKFRLVDIPISNCINSGLNNVYVLTQYNSHSLNRHISRTYKFDRFGSGFVEVLAAQQTYEGTTKGAEQWYQGTADAVRCNLRHFTEGDYDYFLILSGDQLYRMDYRDLFAEHIENDADITIATLPVSRHDAKSFGIMHTDATGKIVEFVEKPQENEVLNSLRMPGSILKTIGREENAELFNASMGIYLFRREALLECLATNEEAEQTDFGKHIIPYAIEKYKVNSYLFEGYWEDIGTVGSFHQANIDLCKVVPSYNFFDPDAPIYTDARSLPASKINEAIIHNALISDGCIISRSYIRNSIIGIRSFISEGCDIIDSIIMGSDYYSKSEVEEGGGPGIPPLGVGPGTRIRKAIIDKNARIGWGCEINPDNKANNYDDPEGRFYIRDGIIVVPKGAVIANESRL